MRRQYSPSRKQLAACIRYTTDVFIFILLEVKGASGAIVPEHFLNSGQARLIRGCLSFSQCFRAGVFSSLSAPPTPLLLTRPIFSPLFEFQHALSRAKHSRARRKRLHCRLSWSLPQRELSVLKSLV